MNVPVSLVNFRRLGLLAAFAILFAAASSQAQNPATTVTVTTLDNQHPISRDIYGVSDISTTATADIKALNDPNNRIGGNNSSTYNWNVQAHAPAGVKLPPGDADNLDNDWYWESYLLSNTPGGFYDGVIAATKTAGVGTQMWITIPMQSYIATVSPGATTSAASLWSYSIKKYGAMVGNSCSSNDFLGSNGYEYDEWQTDAGSGIKSLNGCTLNYVKNNPADAYVPNSPAIQQAYVAYLVKKYGGAADGGIKYYILDNEPSIWSGTHHDIHPAAETYNELWSDIQAYAGAIRAADPNAIIIGPEEWSWIAMWESGHDQQGLTPSDYSTHGNQHYYPWLLQQLAAYKKAHGVSLIDRLSVHCYDDGGAKPNIETRELWDPDYVDPGWFSDYGLNGGVIDWIPLLQKWVDEYNPGMPVGCSEYEGWTDDSTLVGATTQADMLGIFGQYGLDFASNFGTPAYPTYLAFQIYTNYDGKDSGFGDTGVDTTVADPDNLSAFSSLRTSDGALTVVVINKQTGKTPVTIELPDFVPAATASMYQINSATQKSIGAATSVAVSGSGITQTLPGPSVTLFVIPAGKITKAPSKPTGLAAIVGNDSVTLGWNNSLGAASYNLYRSTKAAGPFTTVLANVLDTAGDTYTDKTVTNGTTYYYEIAAVNKIGHSANSTPALAATPQVPPVFTLSATASPNPVVQNKATTLKATVKCTASALTNGAVEILALDPSNKLTVVKKFTAQSFTTGQSISYSTSFTPTSAGTYTLEVAVYSASGQQWSLNAKAGSLTVKSALSFTTSATAPSTLAVNTQGTITVKVTNTGSAAYSSGNVQIAIYPPTGNTAIDTVNETSVDIAAGASKTFTVNWKPAASDIDGNYSVDVGVFEQAWTTDYYWNTNATIKVTGGPAFTASATAAPASIAASASSTVTFSVKDTGGALPNAIVEVQVFNSSGTAVGTGIFSSQNFSAGQTQKYTWAWSPSKQSPAVTAAGAYTVEIGVFDSSWATDYYWNSNASTITITGP